MAERHEPTTGETGQYYWQLNQRWGRNDCTCDGCISDKQQKGEPALKFVVGCSNRRIHVCCKAKDHGPRHASSSDKITGRDLPNRAVTASGDRMSEDGNKPSVVRTSFFQRVGDHGEQVDHCKSNSYPKPPSHRSPVIRVPYGKPETDCCKEAYKQQCDQSVIRRRVPVRSILGGGHTGWTSDRGNFSSGIVHCHLDSERLLQSESDRDV